MTAQGVLDLWKSMPSTKFKAEGLHMKIELRNGEPHWVGLRSGVPTRFFLENEWELIGEWIESSLIDAASAFLYEGKLIKRVPRGGIGVVLNPNEGHCLILDVRSKDCKWYIKE